MSCALDMRITVLVADELGDPGPLEAASCEAGLQVKRCPIVEVLELGPSAGELLVIPPMSDHLVGTIRERLGPDLPIIVLGDDPTVRARLRMLRAGANDYLAQPADPAYAVERGLRLLRAHKDLSGTRPVATTVLIIDDDPLFAGALRRGFEAAGFAVAVASDGQQGLRMASMSRPHVVVIDATMPGLDGFAVIRRMRADPALRLTPCLLLTGGDGHDEISTLEAGADAYLAKADGLEVVLARVQALARHAVDPVAFPAGPLGNGKLLLCAPREPGGESKDDGSIALALTEESCDVVRGESLAEAVEFATVCSVDCVLLDQRLLGSSPRDALMEFRAQPALRDVPLVIIGGSQAPSRVAETLRAGADEHVVSTLDPDLLRARVRTLLSRRQLREANRRLRDALVARELEAAAAHAARTLAETRAGLLGDLEQKNRELEDLITEHKIAEEALVSAKRDAERAAHAKSRFLSTVSHELRTPLNAILGFGRLMDRGTYGELNERQRQFLKDILQAGEHMLRLVDDLLDLQRLREGRVSLMPAPHDFAALASEALRMIQPLALDRSQALELRLPERLPQVETDGRAMVQILVNVLSNAVKYTPERGRIELRARTEARFLVIDVEDNGVGIAPEDQERIFDYFEQVGGKEAHHMRGSGIGLALTRTLVRRLGGQLTVKSTLGRGSTFTFTAPLWDKAGKEAA